MESGLTEDNSSSIYDAFTLTKQAVDHFIIRFDLEYDVKERNETVDSVFKLIQKNYLARPNSKFEKNKMTSIGIVAKSFLLSKIYKKKKSLDNPE